MNGRMAKKVKKEVRKQWRAYLKEIKALGFTERVALAWWLLFGK